MVSRPKWHSSKTQKLLQEYVKEFGREEPRRREHYQTEPGTGLIKQASKLFQEDVLMTID